MIFIVAVLTLLILVYCYGSRTYDYWSKRGIKHDPPVPFLGTSKRQLLQQISHSEIYDEMYWKYPQERYVGYYLTTTPLLILRDPDLVKSVLVSDFNYFSSRSLHPLDDIPEPLLNNLFSCEGELWKFLRQRMTHAFSSGKLKAMFPLIVSRAKKLQQVAAGAACTGKEVDVKDLMARYTMDFIGACGFGLDLDALNEENSIFRQAGHRIFHNTTRDTLVMFCKFLMPSVFKSLHFFSDFVEKNMFGLVKEIMAQREYKPSGRNDFIDLLLEVKAKGKTGYSSIMTNPEIPSLKELELTDDLMVAQVFLFFAAGFETSSNSASYMLHELAHHPKYQKKCHEEIDEVLERYDNKLCYDAVKEMKYLSMCFSETLRVFPPLGYLMRKCEKPYTIPGTDITLDPGVKVVIPLKSFSDDPKYWKDPKQFQPDRFHPNNISKINKNIYLPFGDGPRNCIGERLGNMQSLAGLAAILSRFSVTPGRSTTRHPPLDPAVYIVQSVLGGLPLMLLSRKDI